MDSTEVITGEVTAVHLAYCSVSLRKELPSIPEGSHITFDMADWKGSRNPRPGQIVAMEELTLFSRGWRALSAKPIQI